MPDTSWVQLINNGQYNQQNYGTALSNSTTLTDISPGGSTAGQAMLVPAGYLYDGVQLEVRARGVASTTGSPNLTLGLYYGGVAGTLLASTTFVSSAGLANGAWSVSADIRCDATGTSAVLRTQGSVSGLSSSGNVQLPQTTSSGGSATVSSGTSSILTLGAQWGAANAGNSITCYQWLVFQLN